jgi:glycine cleavage system H protein
MPEKDTRKNWTEADGPGGAKFSRRQFLKRLGITTGGAVVTTLSLLAACKSAEPTTATNPNTSATGSTTPGSTAPTTSTLPASTAPTTNPTPTSSIPVTTVTPSITGTKTTPTFFYTVPSAPPPFVQVPDSACSIATDRLYSADHMWVKVVSENVAVLGITSPMVLLLGDPYNMTLPDVGLKLAKDDTFSTIGGWKIIADIFSPVSGVIVQVNEGLRPYLRGDKIQPIVSHPYTYGWIIAVQMSKPSELDDLLDPLEYLPLLKKGK